MSEEELSLVKNDLNLSNFSKTPDKLQEKKTEIQGHPLINFYDVDWEKIFREFNYSYGSPDDFDKYIKDDGTYDVEKIIRENRLENPARYLTEDGKINTKKIIENFDNSESPIYIKLAIVNSGDIDKKTREELLSIFIDNLKKSLINGLPRFIELIKSLGPHLVDSIEIIEKELPKVLQREYIFKTPAALNGNEEYYLKEYLEQGYSIEEAKELAQETKKYGDFLLMWRQILKWKNLPMKNKEKYGNKKPRHLLNAPTE